jgi:hypothetical protein
VVGLLGWLGAGRVLCAVVVREGLAGLVQTAGGVEGACHSVYVCSCVVVCMHVCFYGMALHLRFLKTLIMTAF